MLFRSVEEKYMTVSYHFTKLNSRHAELKKLIEEEINRPQPDQRIIAKLKKEKLQIKDELAQLSTQ